MRKKIILIIIIAIQILFIVVMAISRYVSVAVGRKITVAVIPVDPRDLFRGEYVNLSYDFSRLSIYTTNLLIENDTVYAILKKDGEVYSIFSNSLTKPELNDTNLVFIKGKSLTPLFFTHVKLENFEEITKKGFLQRNRASLNRLKTLSIRDRIAITNLGETLYIAIYEYNKEWYPMEETVAPDLPSLSNHLERTSYGYYDNIFILKAQVSEVLQYYTAEVRYGIESYFTPEGEAQKIENAIFSSDTNSLVTVELSVLSGGEAFISKLFISNVEVDFTKNRVE